MLMCRGSLALGTACLHCPRCASEALRVGVSLAGLRAVGRRGLPTLAEAIADIARRALIPLCQRQQLMCDP